ncbi:YitT family protein [Propionicimonas sp.]|uniref:YitT family protein n=1 Tax=Propionicimonas sp. TaxID=1955623 RepID=UPI001797D0AC|nr:YitT family protein [Propionicimonas sp.]MBU3977212.1 YitT family protein [Actinomycetota bacterium]MBA3021138.1 YitT family protein [Propionicimonas sp.]MBU3985722.1 YitT family protein [Actinomycetota bacterium]MBU4008507.1 YitT family protein [Actinomycetota bacterium]MBU4066343.1 YitT family protein [Actinomycetota bacterium]
MSAQPVSGVDTQPEGLRHTLLEDVFGLLSGAFVVSLGVYLLKTVEAVTGGTAGLALLLSYSSGWPFGLLFFGINLPFFVLAVKQKGWSFAVRTLISIGLVSGFAFLHPVLMPNLVIEPVYAVLVGNLLAGIGMLMVFRHRASLGGLNTLALLAQDKFGWRAGWVQLSTDAVIIAAALAVVPPANVALSVAGAVVLNIVLALNHRPDRYLGY